MKKAFQILFFSPGISLPFSIIKTFDTHQDRYNNRVIYQRMGDHTFNLSMNTNLESGEISFLKFMFNVLMLTLYEN